MRISLKLKNNKLIMSEHASRIPKYNRSYPFKYQFCCFFFKRERVVFVVGVERGVLYKNKFKEIVETIWTHNILLYTYDTCSYIRFRYIRIYENSVKPLETINTRWQELAKTFEHNKLSIWFYLYIIILHNYNIITI